MQSHLKEAQDLKAEIEKLTGQLHSKTFDSWNQQKKLQKRIDSLQSRLKVPPACLLPLDLQCSCVLMLNVSMTGQMKACMPCSIIGLSELLASQAGSGHYAGLKKRKRRKCGICCHRHSGI